MTTSKTVNDRNLKNFDSSIVLKSFISKLSDIKNILISKSDNKRSNLQGDGKSSDRRDYGLGIRLWNEKDPRVDQGFFSGGVPGFVLSQDQRIIDWNIAFETSFSELPQLRRGMKVADWYRSLDNFRRIPNREEQLYGESVVPITDRDRVVFVSSRYGRMVFMKMMSPILDRVSGRIIGWNISLNVNSVTERVKYFEELHARIQDQSKHARFVVGSSQLHAVSPDYHTLVENISDQLSGRKRVLILGAGKAEGLVNSLLQSNDSTVVSVVDLDSDALRNLKTVCGSYLKRLKLIRRPILECFSGDIERFDAVVVYFPRVTSLELTTLLQTLSRSISENSLLMLAGYNKQDGSRLWWNQNRVELEKAGKIDVLKWHLNSVEERDQLVYSNVAKLPSILEDANLIASISDLEIVGANFNFLKGNVSILTFAPDRARSIAIKAI